MRRHTGHASHMQYRPNSGAFRSVQVPSCPMRKQNVNLNA